MLDVGRHGVIDFGHIRFVARHRVMTYVFREDEFVESCVAHRRAWDIESLREGLDSWSTGSAQVNRQRRQSGRIVWDRASIVMCELEVSQLGYVRMMMGQVSSLGHGAVVVKLLQQAVLSVRGEVDFRVVMIVIRWGRLHRGDGCMCWMAAAVISELEAGPLRYVKMRMGPVSSIGHSVHAVVIGLRGQMKQIIGVVLCEVHFRIGDVMLRVCLEEEVGAITVAAQRLSKRAAH